MSVWLFIWLGCGPKTVSYDGGEAVEVPSMAIARPAGLVHDGVFADETHGFSLPVMEGWGADAGPESGLMRVAMLHVATDTRVEFWVFPGNDIEPRIREGCVWSFRSEGRPILDLSTRVATCVPDDPSGRRIYGTVFSREMRTMQVEVHPPNTALVEGREAGDLVLRSLRW